MNIEAKFRGSGPADPDLRPSVPLPRGGLPGVAIAVIAAFLALLLFLYLNGRRNDADHALQQPNVVDGAFGPAPELIVPPSQMPEQVLIPIAAPPAGLPLIAPARSATPSPTPPSSVTTYVSTPPIEARPVFVPSNAGSPFEPVAPPQNVAGLTEPALVGSPNEDGSAARNSATTGAGPADPVAPASSKAASGPVTASRLTNRASVMPTGTVIPAVLETPIDTTRTGYVRAIVSRDARGFDGRRILVPRGSRLIGEFRADIHPGAKRVLVNWNRLIRPDGVVIQLDSPAADPLGGPGVPATVHGSVLGSFISSAFQSALYVGQTLLGRNSTTVVIGSQGGADGNLAALQVLNPTADRPRRLTVKQGALVNVFVAHDLDFSSGSGRQ